MFLFSFIVSGAITAPIFLSYRQKSNERKKIMSMPKWLCQQLKPASDTKSMIKKDQPMDTTVASAEPVSVIVPTAEPLGHLETRVVAPVEPEVSEHTAKETPKNRPGKRMGRKAFK